MSRTLYCFNGRLPFGDIAFGSGSGLVSRDQQQLLSCAIGEIDQRGRGILR